MKFAVELIDPFGTVIASGEIAMTSEALQMGAITGRRKGALVIESRPISAAEAHMLTDQVTGRDGEFIQRRPVNSHLPYRLRVSV